jgi:hypothetical protein
MREGFFMEWNVYEGSKAVGSLHVTCEGLYLHLEGSLSTEGRLCRVYGICGRHSVYLGLTDSTGCIHKRLTRKGLPTPEFCILSPYGPGQWMPWQGELQTVNLEHCLIKEEGGAFALAIPEEQWQRLPNNIGEGQRTEIYGQRMLLIDPDAPIVLPRIEKENGGKKNEVLNENAGEPIDPLLLADLPADYDYGEGGQ